LDVHLRRRDLSFYTGVGILTATSSSQRSRRSAPSISSLPSPTLFPRHITLRPAYTAHDNEAGPLLDLRSQFSYYSGWRYPTSNGGRHDIMILLMAGVYGVIGVGWLVAIPRSFFKCQVPGVQEQSTGRQAYACSNVFKPVIHHSPAPSSPPRNKP